ncbi:MAG TPA: type I polyketide synthase [Actinocrinis sp.]|jgi:acyl transferase domain-containing protein/acyl carrier protein
MQREHETPEPIAIVGIGLRLPGGCESPDQFDAFLREGRSGIRPIPEDRWDVEALRAEGPEDRGKITTHSGGFLDRIDQFDAPFFNISPREAVYIDPQQRMVLETAWHALEHAGIDPTPLRHGNGGVYMGVSSFDYALRMGALENEELDGHLAAGCTIFSMAGRLSYFLGWRGPSICVDSACSSSLSALHLAVKALHNGECGIALCGGVNAVHHPSFMVMFSHGQMLAPDGQCKTFDESADGYSRAEGCGILVLKRLSDARRDGDNIMALIRGTAIAQDGDSAGLTVPHGPAQEQCLRTALAAAGLAPADIQYVEAHGTGTPLGDPIELGAIANVFADSHSKRAPLVVGSVKTNIGHMEPASGIVGVIKTVLQLRSGTIYPHLNLNEPARRIPWDVYPVEVPTESRPWAAPTRRAVVNSFGFAGTIAATVLEQAPDNADIDAGTDTDRGAAAASGVFTLSAKNAAALRRQAESYRAFLDADPDLDIARLCYSANVGRAHLPSRAAGLVRNRDELARLLDAAAGPGSRAAGPAVRKVAFLFSGQGTQYPGMGAALYRRHAAFRERIDECDRLFAPHLAHSVRALILGEAEDPGLLDQTGYTQPALFAFEYALAGLWMSWGVQPSVLIGHSIGEVAAAAVAGLFSLRDAVTLVAARARLMQSVRRAGGMAAVALPQDQVAPRLTGYPELALAAVNAPDQCGVSGAVEQLEKFVEQAQAEGVRVERLAVSNAFHSPLMAEVFEQFRAAIDTVTFRQPELTLISNVTGGPGRSARMDTPDYWVRHIGEPVLFMAGVQAVEQRGRHAFVEIGPSTALTALAKRCVAAEEHRWVASAGRRDQHGDLVLRGLAELYTAGVNVAWPDVVVGCDQPRIQLPLYPFERKRYWLPQNGANRSGRGAAAHGAAWHPLLGRPVPGADSRSRSGGGPREFAAALGADQPSLLAGHAAADGPVLPAAGYAEIFFALQDAVFGDDRGAVRDLVLGEPLRLPDQDSDPVELHTRLSAADPGDGTARIDVLSGTGDDELWHASATVAPPGPASSAGPDAALLALADSPGAVEETVLREDVYTDFRSVGRHYGDRYRLLSSVSRHADGVVTGELAGRDAAAVEHLPVEVLECALQAIAAVDDGGPALAPLRIGEIRLFRKPRGEHLRMVARVAPAPGDQRRVDLLLLDGDAAIAELTDVTLAVPGEPDERPQFLNRLAWVRRSAEPERQPADRHVLVLGGDRAGAAPAGAAPGIRLSHLAGPEELPGALAEGSVTDVCWFWQLDGGPMSAARLGSESERNYRQLLAVVAALNGAGPGAAPRLWLVTERAQWLSGDQAGTGEQLAAASLWGFGHTLLNEYPRYQATLIDLPAGADLGILADEWRAQHTGDFQIAYRNGQRYVRRLLPGRATPAWDGGFELRAPRGGDPAELVPVPAEDAEPGSGQVQVRVHYAALGPRDVAAAFPATDTADGSTADSEAGPVLGSGCSGTIVAVGPGAGFAVGDRVVADHFGTLRRTVTVPAAVVTTVPRDRGLDVAAAASAARLAGEYGQVRPEPPDTAGTAVFELDEAGEALTRLRRGATAIPVIAVTPAPPAGDADTAAAATERGPVIRPDRVYVISGGLGGLGLATAAKLADLGARHLVLVSRGGRPTPEAATVLEALAERCELTLAQADVSEPADVAELFGRLRNGPVPVGGIVHAAGSAGKSLISALTWPAVEAQLRGQAYGGWLLHEASLDLPELDFFLVHSSIAAVIGGATQAHYAGAFAFLDGLAAWRARQGLPVLAVNWGMWSRVGMSARLEENLAREVERGGIRFFSPARALRTMHRLLPGPTPGQYVAGEWDWPGYAAAGPLRNALYHQVVGDRLPAPASAGAAAARPAVDLAALVAKPKLERLAEVGAVVLASVAAALRAEDEEGVDPAVEFVALGLDSLMALELKTSLEAAFRVPLPASLAFDHPSPQHLTEFLDAQLAPQAG